MDRCVRRSETTHFYSNSFVIISGTIFFILKFQTLLRMNTLLEFKLDQFNVNVEVQKEPLIHIY